MMTIEEKAKAYDEALEKARKHYNSKYHPSEGPSGVYLNNADLEEIFPVLKESEDDRMMEAIEGTIRTYGKTQGEWIGGYDMDTLVVHLRKAFGALAKQKEQPTNEEMLRTLRAEYEKGVADTIAKYEQKEQKPLPKFKVGDTIHCKYDDREFTIKSVDLTNMVYKYTEEGCGNDIDYADEDFELVEPKPAEWSEDERIRKQCIKLLREAYSTKYEALECITYLAKQKEPEKIFESIDNSFRRGREVGFREGVESVKQSTEWSKEDKEHTNSILERLEGMCKKGATFTQTRFAISEDEDWLKSLSERFNLQPKQEWSKEDEYKLNFLTEMLEGLDQREFDTRYMKELSSWLKSLRSRPHWKPSEEQMRAVFDASERNDKLGSVLTTLHRDLKNYFKI